MSKSIKSIKRSEKGFTMIELIIVIAIMGILMAILAPSFIGMTSNAKASSDLRSVQTIQKQVSIYEAQSEKFAAGATVNDVLDALVNSQLLETSATVEVSSSTTLKLQTKDAKLIFEGGILKIDATGTADTDKIFKELAKKDENKANIKTAP